MNRQKHIFETTKSVNVAQVRQLSPFRYPGGKTWFVPYFRAWAHQNSYHRFVEPFAGGGIISLSAGYYNLFDEIIMVELDELVASVWKVIISGDYEWLIDKLSTFEMSVENLNDYIDQEYTSVRRNAFKTILINRTNHGGIMAKGAGRMKTGENNKGIKSRWYPQTLIERIKEIVQLRDKISFEHGDGHAVINRYMSDRDTCFYIDPPYTLGNKKAGRRLYTYNDADHEKLFESCSQVAGDMLMSYSYDSEVISMAESYGLDYSAIPMQGRRNKELSELVISKDNSWIDITSLPYEKDPNTLAIS